MPVSLLFCEGRQLDETNRTGGAPDVRLLRALTRGIRLEVRPVGGKDGLNTLVQTARQGLKNDGICALVDSDFPRTPSGWQPASGAKPWIWTDKGRGAPAQLGWQWARKEIENYFVHPEVLARALRWTDTQRADHQARLDRVMDRLGPMTAGRMALTACAPRRDRLETTLPSDKPVEGIREKLRQRALEHGNAAVLSVEVLLAEFERLLPDCQPGGRFRQHALEVFAGKNIRACLNTSKGWPTKLKAGPQGDPLIERVLLAIEDDPAPHEWLAEWTSLREAILNWPAA